MVQGRRGRPKKSKIGKGENSVDVKKQKRVQNSFNDDTKHHLSSPYSAPQLQTQNVEEVNHDGQGSMGSAIRPTESFNMTEIADQTRINDDVEVDSQGSDGILVGDYRVKAQHISLWNSIVSKHGDVIAQCSTKPLLIKSVFVNYLCFVVHKLQNTEFMRITSVELKDMLSNLRYFEQEGVNVGWLKKVVEDIFDAKQGASKLSSSSNAKQLLRSKELKIQRAEEELQVIKKEYALKEAELTELKEKINVAEIELFKEKAEAQETRAMLSDYKAKLSYVYNQFNSLVRNLT